MKQLPVWTVAFPQFASYLDGKADSEILQIHGGGILFDRFKVVLVGAGFQNLSSGILWTCDCLDLHLRHLRQDGLAPLPMQLCSIKPLCRNRLLWTGSHGSKELSFCCNLIHEMAFPGNCCWDKLPRGLMTDALSLIANYESTITLSSTVGAFPRCRFCLASASPVRHIVAAACANSGMVEQARQVHGWFVGEAGPRI